MQCRRMGLCGFVRQNNEVLRTGSYIAERQGTYGAAGCEQRVFYGIDFMQCRRIDFMQCRGMGLCGFVWQNNEVLRNGPYIASGRAVWCGGM